MGPIQSNINQILGTAAIGAGFYAQSPMGKRIAELRQLKVRTPQVQKQYETLVKQTGDKPLESASEGEREAYFNVVGQGRDIAKRRFELKPTNENLNRYISSINTGISKEEYAAEIAEKSMQDAQNRIKAQKDIIAGGPYGRNK